MKFTLSSLESLLKVVAASPALKTVAVLSSGAVAGVVDSYIQSAITPTTSIAAFAASQVAHIYLSSYSHKALASEGVQIEPAATVPGVVEPPKV